MSLLPVAEALERLLQDAGPGPAERVPLRQAAGRVLAADLCALRTQPPFDVSAMDGFAVRAADVAHVPARLAIVGTAAAGHRFDGAVGAGQAVRIFTGAPLPRGADTIVIQENTRPDGDGVEVLEPLQGARHIRRRGMDFAEGQRLLEKGRVLDPAALSLAAAANHPALDVVRRPLVALLATGDELVEPGAEPGPDQIVASNSFGVGAIAEASGARAIDLGIAPDSLQEISRRIAQADAAGADVVVTLGGASVGDHDLVNAALQACGVEMAFWKIAMRPGKPLMFGRKGFRRYLGLPGNPVASLVCAELFLKPLLARLGGLPCRHGPRQAVLGQALAANDLRQTYLRAVVAQKDGALVATPFGTQDSAMLRFMADAGALIVRPPFDPARAAGEPCTVLMLR